MADVSVVMHSTSSLEDDIEKAKGFGAQYYLVKTAHFDAMCKMLRLILGIEGDCDPGSEKGVLYYFSKPKGE